MERNKGHGAHNLVTAVMHEKNTDVQGAFQWIEEWHASLVTEFLEVQTKIPEGDAIQRYVHGIGNWIRGTDCWAYESGRYFGDRGLQVQQTRWLDAGMDELL